MCIINSRLLSSSFEWTHAVVYMYDEIIRFSFESEKFPQSQDTYFNLFDIDID